MNEIEHIQIPGVSVCLQDVLSQPTSACTSQPITSNVITTSIDEGVEADIMDSRDNDDIIMHKGQTFVRDGFGLGLIPSSAFGDFSQLSNTSLASLGTSSTGSPFTSFDSSLEADLVSSLSGFNNITYPVSSCSTPVTIDPAMGNMVQASGCTSVVIQGQNTEDIINDRSQNTSPVDFREGRRASDGLVAQGIIAFRQRLKESMKCQGMVELRTEHQQVHNVYGIKMAPSSLVQDHTEDVNSPGQQYVGQTDNQQQKKAPRPLMKRMSLPSETVDLQPHKLLAIKQSMHLEQQMDRVVSQDSVQQPMFGESSKPLQQQLLQHRLQQKRQSFHQKNVGNPLHHQMQQLQLDTQLGMYPPHSSQQSSCDSMTDMYSPPHCSVSQNNALVHTQTGDPSLIVRPQIIRKTSYKLAQQQPVLPESHNTSDLLPWQRAILEREGHQVHNQSDMSGNQGLTMQPMSDLSGRRSGYINFVQPSEFRKQQVQNQPISELDFNQCPFDYDNSGMDTECDQEFSLDNYVQDENPIDQQSQQYDNNISDGQNFYPTPSQQQPFNMTVNMTQMEDTAMDFS
jgi:serine/threonine-protein kinase SIK2